MEQTSPRKFSEMQDVEARLLLGFSPGSRPTPSQVLYSHISNPPVCFNSALKVNGDAMLPIPLPFCQFNSKMMVCVCLTLHCRLRKIDLYVFCEQC